MVDVGSTTADVVPIAAAAGSPPPAAPTSTGCWPASSSTRARCAPTSRRSRPRVPVRGSACPVASELFAISADVHLILGHLTPGAYTCATPDGRPATVEFARERVARLVCADAEQMAAEEIDAIATFLHGEQVRQIEAAARRVSGAHSMAPAGGPAGRWSVPRARGRRAAGARDRGAAVERGRAGRGARRRARRTPGQPAAPAVLTVVKVGGGLAREAGDGALRTLCRAIGDAGARHPLLVVPGGAAFADAVREQDSRFDLRAATAHRMAILAMDQFGWLLCDLIPGAVPCTDLAAARAPPPRDAGPAAGGRARRGPAARLMGRHVRLDRRLGRR